MADEKKSLEDRVADWLEKQGYRLEYTTQRALRKAGFKALISMFLESKQGKAARKLDRRCFCTN